MTEGWGTGCEANQTFCGNVCINGSSCFGVNSWCELDCPEGETCCSNTCVSGSSCVGQTCSSRSDCKFDESCCSGECKSGYDCIGQLCSRNADCGHPEYCCGYVCSSLECSVSSGIVVGSVFGTPLVILMICLSVYFASRRFRGVDRVGFEGQREMTETTVNETEPIYLGQSPPSYQEDDPYHPPPEYMEYPPCNVGSCEPPPPYSSYSAALNERSAVPNNYGATQKSDLPV